MLAVSANSLPIQVDHAEENHPGEFTFYGVLWLNDFGKFKGGETSPKLKVNYIKGELIEFVKGEPFKNGNGYYLKPGRLVKFQYKII